MFPSYFYYLRTCVAQAVCRVTTHYLGTTSSISQEWTFYALWHTIDDLTTFMSLRRRYRGRQLTHQPTIVRNSFLSCFSLSALRITMFNGTGGCRLTMLPSPRRSCSRCKLSDEKACNPLASKKILILQSCFLLWGLRDTRILWRAVVDALSSHTRR